MGYVWIQRIHKQIPVLRYLGPTSKEVTPLCWWYLPDQREAACWGHPHPRRAGPLGPPQGVMSGPDSSGTWRDRTQETDAPINSSLPSKPSGRHSSSLRHVSNLNNKNRAIPSWIHMKPKNKKKIQNILFYKVIQSLVMVDYRRIVVNDDNKGFFYLVFLHLTVWAFKGVSPRNVKLLSQQCVCVGVCVCAY